VYSRDDVTANRAAFLLLLLAGCSPERAALSRQDWKAPVGCDAGRGLESTAAQATRGEEADTHSDESSSEGQQQSQPATASETAPPEPTVGAASELANDPEPTVQAVWGLAGLRGYPVGEHVASNGVEFHQLFSLDLDFNLWLWPSQGLYYFMDSRFWGQKAAPGVTNPSQGAFDFSKREFDFFTGLAWNYHTSWEARAFAYSFNNLNRGDSSTSPSGFNDGVGLENRYYLGPTYQDLGTSAFDQARATFLSVGYYPSKSMVDGNGEQFSPGPFARAYLTWDLFGEQCYLFGDVQFLATRAFRPKLFNVDAGIAFRPFANVPRLEFRVGSEDVFDLQGDEWEVSTYLGVRYIF
jgi:hypothetical protein